MRSWVGAVLLLGLLTSRAFAQPGPVSDVPSHQDESPPAAPSEHEPPQAKIPPSFIVGGQINLIGQSLGDFRSPYAGQNSLNPGPVTEISQLATLFLGYRTPLTGLELYLNPEITGGHGLSGGFGLAGYPNGDVLRNPVLGGKPYLGRYFARYTGRTGPGDEPVEPSASANQVGGSRPLHRIVVTAGKIGAGDLFDLNRYANGSKTQFFNWSLINNAAWDYAADLRGYTQGVAVEWIHPHWALRFGSFQEPTTANGVMLDPFVLRARGDNLEYEVHPQLLGPSHDPAVVRLLLYQNTSNQGLYARALSDGLNRGTTPSVVGVESPGTGKVGAGFNLEQPLADDGNTGVFARYGWNDGKAESFAFTECEATLSFGGQISGKRWNRANDCIGVGFVQNRLSPLHRAYLAAGGVGFIIGDGRLNYAPERIAEVYYRYQLFKACTLSADLQYIQNPAYNHDRGPVLIPGLRLHLEF